MADITNFSLVDATERTTTSTSFVEMTDYTVSWSDLTTAGFANLDDVIVLVQYTNEGSTTSVLATSEVRKGSSFAGASVLHTTAVESRSGTATFGALPVYFLDRLTLTTSDNIYISLKASAGTARSDDFSILILKLDDLDADDFRYSDDTYSGDAPNTPTDAVTVTLPSASGDDWLVIGNTTWLVDQTSAYTTQKLNIATVDQTMVAVEGKDLNEILSHGMFYYHAAAGASDVCKIIYDHESGASPDSDLDRAAIFALRMNAFTDYAGSSNTTNRVIGPSLDTYVETHTDDLSVTTTGDCAYFMQSVTDGTVNAACVYHKAELDGTEIVSGYGRLGTRIRDALDDKLSRSSFGIASFTSGTRTLSIDCAEDLTGNTYNMNQHTIAGFSMDLVGGGTVLPQIMHNRQQQR